MSRAHVKENKKIKSRFEAGNVEACENMKILRDIKAKSEQH